MSSVNAPDSFGCTPLICATYYGATACVEFLLKTPGVDINARDAEGRMALHWAAITGNVGCIALVGGLWQKQVSLEDISALSPEKFFADIYDKTPLHYLCEAHRPDCIEALFSTASNEGNTPKPQDNEVEGIASNSFFAKLIHVPDPDVSSPSSLSQMLFLFITLSFFSGIDGIALCRGSM